MGGSFYYENSSQHSSCIIYGFLYTESVIKNYIFHSYYSFYKKYVLYYSFY